LRVFDADYSNGKKGSYWKVKCNCGKITSVREGDLLAGNTQSCGCQKITKFSKSVSHPNPQRASFNEKYRSYKESAGKKDKSFELPAVICHLFFQEKCFYCLSLPKQKFNIYFKKDGSFSSKAEKVQNKSNEWNKRIKESTYFYNGIDRVKNDEGYYQLNCVPCCFECNEKKKAMNFFEFAYWIERVTASFLNTKLDNRKASKDYWLTRLSQFQVLFKRRIEKYTLEEARKDKLFSEGQLAHYENYIQS